MQVSQGDRRIVEEDFVQQNITINGFVHDNDGFSVSVSILINLFEYQ